MHIHIDLRVGLVKARQQLGQHRKRSCRNGSKTQSRRSPAPDGGQRFRHLLQSHQHAACCIDQGLACHCGPYAACMALEELDVQNPLKLGQGLGGRRLTHVQLHCRLHDRATLLQSQQKLQLTQPYLLDHTGEEQAALGACSPCTGLPLRERRVSSHDSNRCQIVSTKFVASL